MQRFLALTYSFLCSTLLSFAQQNFLHLVDCQEVDTIIPLGHIQDVSISQGAKQVVLTLHDGATICKEGTDISALNIESLPPLQRDYHFLLENDDVHRYRTTTTYDPDDYSYTLVSNYNRPFRDLDRPNPIVIRLEAPSPTGRERVVASTDPSFASAMTHPLDSDSVVIWNTIPGETLYYRILESESVNAPILQQGAITTEGQVRMIYTPNIHNIRDLGGWPLEGGGRIRYGKIFRGAKFHDAQTTYMTSADSLLLRALGIQCEFDLRGGDESYGSAAKPTKSILGRDVDYVIHPVGSYAYRTALEDHANHIRYIWNLVKKQVFAGKTIYMHCSQGCDRAGTWAFLIEGLLGVSEDNIVKDYELSSFTQSDTFHRWRNEHTRNPYYDFHSMMDYIKEQPGNSLQEKFENFLIGKCMIPQTEIDQLKEQLIER